MTGHVLLGAVITPPHPGPSSNLSSSFPLQLLLPCCLHLLQLFLLHMTMTYLICMLRQKCNPCLFLLLPPLFFLLFLLLPPLFFLCFLLLPLFLLLSPLHLLLLSPCLLQCLSLLLMPCFLHLLPLEFSHLHYCLFLPKELHLHTSDFFVNGGWQFGKSSVHGCSLR